MRVLVLIKATDQSEAGQPNVAMTRFTGELVRSGILLACEDLQPSSRGIRISNHVLTDGPFPETKQLVAAFWLWQVRSMDEAVAWVKRIPDAAVGEVEIRPVREPTPWP